MSKATLSNSMTDEPVVASGTPPTQSATVTAEDLLPRHLLDGGEVVIFAIKPSLWFILFASAKWLAAMILLLIVAPTAVRFLSEVGIQSTSLKIAQGALTVGGLRVGFALLQWVSRLYVLTNRRIMRIRGIVNVDLFECALTKLQNTYLSLAWYERVLGLGTITFSTAGTAGANVTWAHVPHPLEVHEQVRDAMHRARGGNNGL